MTGNIYHGQVGLPFSSALRIYEPLEAFPEQQQESLRAAGAGQKSRAAVENAELLASLGRITRQDGDPFPTGRTDLVRVVPAPAKQASAGAAHDAAESVPGLPPRRRPTGCCTAPASWSSAPGWPPTP